MRQFIRSWGATLRAVVLMAAIAGTNAGSAQATTIGAFETDTSYAISGSFHFGVLGQVEFLTGSVLYYDSNTKTLSVDGTLKQKNGSATYDLDMDLGQARGSGNGAQFAFPDGSYSSGMSRIGSLTPLVDVRILHKNIAANTLMPLFGHGGAASIKQEGNNLVFRNWVKLWGAPLGFDVAADPVFYLTKIPGGGNNNGGNNGTEVPEPMTMSLLGMGLVGAAVRRKRAAQ